MSGTLVYDDTIVNATIGKIKGLNSDIHSVGDALSAAISQLTSATGFGLLGCSISTADAANAVSACESANNSLINMCRSMQTEILMYDGNGDAIRNFLSTLSKEELANAPKELQEIYAKLSTNSASFLERTGATIFTGFASILEGVMDFGETLVDLGDILTTSAQSIFTGSYDLVNKLLGNDTSITKNMWEETKARVSDKKVESIFNSFYDETKLGQNVKNNAYFFDTVRSIGSGIAYTAGVTAMSVLTGGIASGAIGAAGTVSATNLALTGGMMGLSSSTEDAWANGASVTEGLARGAAGGVWEGAQWYIGGKIGSEGGWGDQLANKIFKGSANKAQISSARIALDAVDSGVEGYVQPALDLMYKDSYFNDAGEEVVFTPNTSVIDKYKELYDDAGGFGNVLIQAGIGAGGSAIGEGLDLVKILKSEGKSPEISDIAGVGSAATGLSLLDKAQKIFTGTNDKTNVNLHQLDTPTIDIQPIDTPTSTTLTTDVNKIFVSDPSTPKQIATTKPDISLKQVDVEQIDIQPIDTPTSTTSTTDVNKIFASDPSAPKQMATTKPDIALKQVDASEIFEPTSQQPITPDQALKIYDVDPNAQSIFRGTETDGFVYERTPDGTQYRHWKDYESIREQHPHYQDIVENATGIPKESKKVLEQYSQNALAQSYLSYNGLLRDTIFDSQDGKINQVTVTPLYDEQGPKTVSEYAASIKSVYGGNIKKDMTPGELYFKWLADQKKDITTLVDQIYDSRLQEATCLFRGETQLDSFAKRYGLDLELPIEEIEKQLVGKKYPGIGGFMSTSLSSSSDPIKQSKVVFQLYCNEGTPAFDIHAIVEKLQVAEQEVMLAPGTEFDIFKVEKVGDQFLVHVKQSPDYDANVAKKIFNSELDKQFKGYEDLFRETFDDLPANLKKNATAEEIGTYIKGKFTKQTFKDKELYKTAVDETVEILDRFISDRSKNQTFAASAYYELLSIEDVIPPKAQRAKTDILIGIINGNQQLRESIYTGVKDEVSMSLQEMFGIYDTEFAQEVTDSLLGGKNFVESGIGAGADWDHYIELMESRFTDKIQLTIDSGKEPVFWGNFRNEFHSPMNNAFTTIENTTVGENLPFLDVVYPNWNQNSSTPRLEDLWGKLSKSYADGCCSAINPETGQPYESFRFLHPENKDPTSCFGNLFKEVELPTLLSHPQIKTITLTGVTPETMEIKKSIDIDLSDIRTYYEQNHIDGISDSSLNEELLRLFKEKVVLATSSTGEVQ